MATELAIMYGFVGTAAVLTYIGFKFNDSEQEMIQMIGLMMITVVLLMLFGALISVHNIAQQNSLSYLNNTLEPYITVMLVVIILIMLMFLFKIFHTFYIFWKHTLLPKLEIMMRFRKGKHGKT